MRHVASDDAPHVMHTARMHAVVLQHTPREGSAAIGVALRARGIDERVVRIDRGETVPSDLDGAAALLVMGGPMGVYEADRFPHLHDELRLIERAVAHGVPVLGVCLGSQLVAAALGARVERAARREIGWGEVRLREAARDDAMWAGGPASFVPLHWHGDVFELPRGAVSLASSAETEHQAFRFGTSVWGVLFHAELDAAGVAAFTEDFAAELPGPPGDILAPAGEHLAALAPVRDRAFAAWADRIVAARA